MAPEPRLPLLRFVATLGWSSRISRTPLGFEFSAPFAFSDRTGYLSRRHLVKILEHPAGQQFAPFQGLLESAIAEGCAPVNGLAGCYVSTIGKPREYFDLTGNVY